MRAAHSEVVCTVRSTASFTVRHDARAAPRAPPGGVLLSLELHVIFISFCYARRACRVEDRTTKSVSTLSPLVISRSLQLTL